MKNREVHFMQSFRVRIVIYSFLSLFYTAVTEGIIYFILKGIRSFFYNTGPAAGESGNQAAFHNAVNNSLNNKNYPNFVNMPPLEQFRKPFPAILIFLMILIGILFFILYFLLLTKRFSLYLDEIVVSINRMAAGDLTTPIEIKGEDEFAIIGKRLNVMAYDLRVLMENERKNEKVKNDLITNVAHDLRTPLTSIIGYLDLTIKQPDLDPAKRMKYIQVAYDKSIRLEKLIGDLFSYTKFNSEEMKLNVTSIDFVKFMEQMIEEFYPAFTEEGLTCEFVTDQETAMIQGDGDILARAFSNLISNAVKYGKNGKNIRIRIKQDEQEVMISIINYGEVIPKRDLKHVFDRFYRVENSRNSETGGTGLGLAIAKKAVLMHGGSIHVSSSLEGTIFEVILKKGEIK